MVDESAVGLRYIIQFKIGSIVQLVEHLLCKQKVIGSIPITSKSSIFKICMSYTII